MLYRTDPTDIYIGQDRENFATSISRRRAFAIIRYDDGQNAHRNPQEGSEQVFVVSDPDAGIPQAMRRARRVATQVLPQSHRTIQTAALDSTKRGQFLKLTFRTETSMEDSSTKPKIRSDRLLRPAWELEASGRGGWSARRRLGRYKIIRYCW